MKKRHLAGTAGLLLLALWATACSTSSNNAIESRYSNSSSKKVKDAASGSNDKGFVGNRYTKLTDGEQKVLNKMLTKSPTIKNSPLNFRRKKK